MSTTTETAATDPRNETKSVSPSTERIEAPVVVKAGSVVFFNGYLLHRSRKNRNQIFRRVLVSHYCNAWSLLPWQVKQGESVPSADRGNIVPVAGVDPSPWKGLETPPKDV